MLDFSDHKRTGISILTSAADSTPNLINRFVLCSTAAGTVSTVEKYGSFFITRGMTQIKELLIQKGEHNLIELEDGSQTYDIATVIEDSLKGEFLSPIGEPGANI